MGEDLWLYYHSFPFSYLAQDVILDHSESRLWDDGRTSSVESERDILERALSRSVAWLRTNLGENVDGWRWGRIHKLEFIHGGGGGIWGRLYLNRGPFPAAGDNNTICVGGFVPDKGGYGVLTISSLRMIADLSDIGHVRFVCPMGQSGQPEHRFYDNMIEAWRNNGYFIMWFNKREVEREAIFHMRLLP